MLKLLKIIEIKENFSPKNGKKKTLYGITNIKKTTQNGKLDNSSVISNKSSFSDNNITNSKENVKLPSTKYSMQENQNNTVDSQGRNLSKGQQEYFKDSKVRDENGNLKVLYHGTRNDFTVFDINKSGSSSKQAKAGFWFTESSEGARKFADSVWYGKNDTSRAMEVYLNIKKPKIYNDIDNSNKTKKVDNKIKQLEEKKKIFDNKYYIDYFSRNDNEFTKIVGMVNSKYSNYTDNDLLEIIKDMTFTKDSNQYLKDVKEYANISQQLNDLYRKKQNLALTDSYEQFRGDIYSLAGKDIYDANVGGTGVFLENENEIMQKYIDKLKKEGYDGIIIKNTLYDSQTLGEKNNQYVAFYPYQIKNVDNLNPTNNEDIRYSQNNQIWQEYLEENYLSSGTRTNMQNIKMPTMQDIQSVENNNINLPNPNRVLNPLEISKLTPEDASTTPPLPNVRRNRVNDGNSSFASNIQNKTNMLNEEQKGTILSDEEVRYYDKITNKESLEKAFEKLNNNGRHETESWFAKDSENATATDVAEGWILLKQYADNNDSDGMVAVAKKLRDMGTKAGQTVQAFNIMARMTPEGMVKYAQSELLDAYDKMVRGKTKKWIDQHQKDFDLTPQETGAIMEIMQKVSTMPDGYEKRVELAKIQKIMTDKLPPAKGAGTKAWMRISMLFNPKTQVRNVMGNAVIAPVNAFGDLFASMADKVIGSKTGYRTTGVTNIQNYVKGFKEGLYQSYNDFKQGINTRNIDGNRFEIGEGKSFNDNTAIGKSLNKVDSLLSFMLDAGDRTFYEATFTNSINNQLVLNNTTEVTQDMIDIATQEALSRTWQDNNNYTRFVLNVRKMMNNIHVGGYGLGDVLIPFAKTPANLTKAIVDYSPAGVVTTLIKGKNLKNAIETGQFTPQMQHDFVQSLGKATVGTMLYVAGYALAKAGVVSGESDDDKDVRDFMKNTLGVNSYSIKIGNKSFTYDWAQPIAAPLSIMANIVQKDKEDVSTLEKVISSLDTAGNILLEQSFMESINTALSNNDGLATGIEEAILELPARAVPTLMKQIVDLTDSTQRQSFEYDKPIQSMINSVKAKIPGLSQTLAPSVDTMGREIQRYGGKNNIFNVFLNPANVSTENISESAGEIYRLYQETSDATIMPRVPDYKYKDKDGNEVALNSSQRAEFLKISGNIIEENVGNLLNNSDYEKLNDSDKSNLIKSIVDFSYNKAREEVLNIPMSKEYNKINEYLDTGGDVADYYMNKDEINYSIQNPEKYATIIQITDYNKYLDYKNELDKLRDNTDDKKVTTINYINSLKLSIPQKAMFIKQYYTTFDNYNEEIIKYVDKNVKSMEEKILILTELGFTVRNGRVYW